MASLKIFFWQGTLTGGGVGGSPSGSLVRQHRANLTFLGLGFPYPEVGMITYLKSVS